jgi:hypothetical protein
LGETSDRYDGEEALPRKFARTWLRGTMVGVSPSYSYSE